MSNIHSAKGIILGRINYAEADKIVTFISEDFGKTRFIAKGIRKQKSKMAGGLELFSVSEIHFIKGRGDIDTLTSARLVKHYSNIVKDLGRTEVAYSILKTVDKIVEDRNGGEYYEALNDSLNALDSHAIETGLVKMSFDMRVIHIYGSLPDFTIDKNGHKIDQDERFSFDPESMSFEVSSNGKYNKNHIKLLKLMAYNPIGNLLAIDNLSKYAKELMPVIAVLGSDVNII